MACYNATFGSAEQLFGETARLGTGTQIDARQTPNQEISFKPSQFQQHYFLMTSNLPDSMAKPEGLNCFADSNQGQTINSFYFGKDTVELKRSLQPQPEVGTNDFQVGSFISRVTVKEWSHA